MHSILGFERIFRTESFGVYGHWGIKFTNYLRTHCANISDLINTSNAYQKCIELNYFHSSQKKKTLNFFSFDTRNDIRQIRSILYVAKELVEMSFWLKNFHFLFRIWKDNSERLGHTDTFYMAFNNSVRMRAYFFISFSSVLIARFLFNGNSITGKW